MSLVERLDEPFQLVEVGGLDVVGEAGAARIDSSAG